MLLPEALSPVTNNDFDLRGPAELSDPALVRLLSLFPSAKPANIPVRVGLPAGANGGSERSTIMFRGSDFAIFLLKSPLYGVSAIRLRPSPSAQRDTSATVVALMPCALGFAVAVRFLEEIPKWLLKA